MATLSRCLCSLALIGNTIGARISKQRRNAPKLIGDVPVLNYPALSASNAEQEWVVMAKADVSDAQLKEICSSSRTGCESVGSPSEGGVPFFKLRGTENDLRKVLIKAGGQQHLEYVEVDQTWYAIPEMSADAQASTWGLNKVGADSRTSTGRGATVYILATGIRHSHRDFGGRARSGAESLGSLRECNGASNCAG